MPMAPTKGGTTRGSGTRAARSVRPGKAKRSRINATAMPIADATSVAATATPTALTKPVTYVGFPASRVTYASVGRPFASKKAPRRLSTSGHRRKQPRKTRRPAIMPSASARGLFTARLGRDRRPCGTARADR
jgi:hypothetical protein